MFNLSEEFRESRGTWLVNEIRQAVRDRSPLDAKLQTIRALYWMDKDPIGSLPWEGASDIHLPVIYEKVETAVPKIMNAFWGTEPIVHVKRVADEFAPEDTDAAEKILNWGIDSDIYPNFYDTSESWFRNSLRDGLSSVKITWRREWEKIVEVHRVKAIYNPGDVTPYGAPIQAVRPKLAEEILLEIFGMPEHVHGLRDAEEMDSEEFEGEQDFPDIVGRRFEIEFIEGRRKLYGTVCFKPGEYVDEVEVHVYRKVLRFDQPCIEVVEHEDLILPFRAQNLQEASWVAQQYWLDKSEIQDRMEQGLFHMSDEDYDRLMARRTVRVEEMEENDDLKRQKDRVTGEGNKDQRHQTAATDKGRGQVHGQEQVPVLRDLHAGRRRRRQRSHRGRVSRQLQPGQDRWLELPGRAGAAQPSALRYHQVQDDL
jgi:hypothetical protein